MKAAESVQDMVLLLGQMNQCVTVTHKLTHCRTNQKEGKILAPEQDLTFDIGVTPLVWVLTELEHDSSNKK